MPERFAYRFRVRYDELDSFGVESSIDDIFRGALGHGLEGRAVLTLILSLERLCPNETTDRNEMNMMLCHFER
jgi:hypothetical protein